MDKPDIIIFIPVGTSLIGNSADNIQNRWNTKASNDPALESFKNQIIQDCELKNDLLEKPHCAEISSLYLFIKECEDEIKNKKVLVYLLNALDNADCAEMVKTLIKKDTYLRKPVKSIWEVESEKLENLVPKDKGKFELLKDELFDFIQKKIPENYEGDIFINITGGYKGLIPYITIMGILLGNHVKIFYRYESSREIVFLEALPLAFDLFEWRDCRSMLLPFFLGDVLSLGQKETLFKGLSKTKLEGLINVGNGYTVNGIGELIRRKYDKKKGVDISEFGKGAILTDRFTESGGRYKSILLQECIPKWRHLSTGDHIPETVEHGRGHIQRLLELANQLLNSIDLKLSDEQLFVLICSIWLHDIGHTGDYFTFQGKEGVFRKNGYPDSKDRYYCFDNPEKVRKFHNFLSYELIMKEKEKKFLFPSDFTADTKGCELLNSIAFAALYHRKKMPVHLDSPQDDVVYEDEIKVTKGIKNLEENKEVIKGFGIVVGLLRFLDGCENQEERAGGRAGGLNYYEVNKWVLDRQSQAMKEYDCKRYKNIIDFKEKQKGYFKDHQLIENVFIVGEDGTSYDRLFVYGNKNGNDNTLGIYFKVKDNLDDNDGRERLEKNNLKPTLDEFLKVETLLPFNVLFFTIEKNKNRTEKKQILITSEQNKKPEEWNLDYKTITN
ncbi:MAG: hypothetical protein HOJ48_01830 [Desulfobacula sp.]|jgi:hypothetical protein|nr:hypothetical protein [Desulfobacula sp.]